MPGGNFPAEDANFPLSAALGFGESFVKLWRTFWLFCFFAAACMMALFCVLTGGFGFASFCVDTVLFLGSGGFGAGGFIAATGLGLESELRVFGLSTFAVVAPRAIVLTLLTDLNDLRTF